MDTLILIFTNAWLLAVDMAPYLMLGFLMAGLLHVLVPERLIARHMGNESLGAVIKASLIGIPLPICSCGVLPVATSLRNSGAGRAPTVSFLITTPVTGVDSIMATFALLGWLFTVVRVAVSLIIGLVAGVLVALFDRRKPEAAPRPEPAAAEAGSSLMTKLLAALKYGFYELPLTMAGSVLLGLLLGGVITSVIPASFITEHVGTGILGLLLSVAVAIPLYVCATGSIPIAVAMMVTGFSPGAALAFLIAGPATNAVAITTVKRVLGTRSLLIYLAAIFGGAVLFGALFDQIISAGVVSSLHLPAHNHHEGPSLISLLTGGALVGLFGILYIKSLPFVGRLLERKRDDSMAPSVTFFVPDMTCNHCKMNVTKILTGVEGVEHIDVNLGTKEVHFDVADAVPLATIVERLKEGGYSAEVK